MTPICKSLLPVFLIWLLLQVQSNNVSAQEKNRQISVPAFDEVIKPDARVDSGMFNVYRQGGGYYFEIPDSLLGRDIMVVGRITRSGAGIPRLGRFEVLQGGRTIEQVIRFVKSPDNPDRKIYLQVLSFAERSGDSTEQGLYHAVSDANVQPNVTAFDIQARSKNTTGSVIDMTGLVSNDKDILFFRPAMRSTLGVGGFQPDRSYIRYIHSYPVNIEIRAVQTFSNRITVEINSSLLLLSKQPMRPRYADPRVGYDTRKVIDFDHDPQGVVTREMITRWRLEPGPGDLEKYKRGELVEPQKPIIFYIDPATPAKWIPYFIKGVNDWQPAFEQAGFKNAIMGKVAPTREEDSTWSLYDVRYGAIVYQPLELQNATYTNIVDPRSGEILESRVLWSHNEIKELRNRYFIQASASDLRARKLVFADSLMGELIRLVISHEVGHALGFPHNFIASNAVPVEKLRDKQWVEKNGISPSIMDYSRFNYVAQPEDHVNSEKGLFNDIGDYDKWAIEWGYRFIPGVRSEQAEKDTLNKWILAKANDKKYRFNYKGDQDDPRSQSEDIGDDAMQASYYGIKNLKYILSHLVEWTKAPGETNDALQEIYNELVKQFTLYLNHVTRNVGGVCETIQTTDQGGQAFEPVPGIIQKKAISFLDQQLFTIPAWLLNKDIFDRTGINGFNVVDKIQTDVLNRLLSAGTIGKMVNAEATGNTGVYTALGLFADLRRAIWTELFNHKTITMYRQNLQQRYLEKLAALLQTEKTNASLLQVPALARAILLQCQKDIQTAIPLMKDQMSMIHLKEMSFRITIMLNQNISAEKNQPE